QSHSPPLSQISTHPLPLQPRSTLFPYTTLFRSNFSVLFSADNGANWTTINNNVASQLRSYEWLIPGGISSSQCLVRVTRNGSGEQAQSKPFVISGRPVAELSPGTEQCPGSIKISWNPVTGASAYRLFRKIGSEMVSVATTAGTSYT